MQMLMLMKIQLALQQTCTKGRSSDVNGSVIYLQPKGVNTYPSRAQEVREAVVCILEVLKVCICIFCLKRVQAHAFEKFYMLIRTQCFTETSVGGTSPEMLCSNRKRGFSLIGIMPTLCRRPVPRCTWIGVLVYLVNLRTTLEQR